MHQLNNDIISKESEDVSLGDITAPVIIKYAGKLSNQRFELGVDTIKSIAEYIEKNSGGWMHKLDNKIFSILKSKEKNIDDESLKRFSKLFLINIVALFALNIAKRIEGENVDTKNIESYLNNFSDFDQIISLTKEDVEEMINKMLK